MPIQFVPSPGQVLMCAFDAGSLPPEMRKTRQVVVVSPRRRKFSGSYLVVPFSTVKPDPVEGYHLLIPAGAYDFFRADTDVWLKGDMVTHVSAQRLDRLFVNGAFCSPSVSKDDFKCIQQCVAVALGLIAS